MVWKHVVKGVLGLALVGPALAAPPAVNQSSGPQATVAREVHRDVSRPMREYLRQKGRRPVTIVYNGIDAAFGLSRLLAR